MDFVPSLKGRKIIDNKWVFRVKKQSDGQLDKLKSKSYWQKIPLSFDFFETFSSIVKSVTVHIVLNITLTYKWSIGQLDVNNIFLNDTFNEEVFMKQVSGFIDPDHTNFVCKLEKSFYGLKPVLYLRS